MEGEDVTMFRIMSLPEEVRGQIYNFFGQKEAMGLRLVCRQWQEELHTFYNYNLKLDKRKIINTKPRKGCTGCRPHEKHPHLQTILDRQRITNCTTGQFLLTSPERTSLFKHANAIQSLNISKCGISPGNLQALLTECAKSLKRLEIHLNRTLLRYEYPQNLFNFPNLRTLLVFVCIRHPCQEVQTPVPQAHVDQEVLTITRLIRDSHKPKLTTLSIELNFHNQLQVDWYSSTILSTVANHSKTLSQLNWELLDCDPSFIVSGTFPLYKLGQRDSARIKRMDSLKYLNIHNDYVEDDEVGVIDLGLFKELTMTQKELMDLSIQVEKFELVFLQEICGNCFGTLVCIDVRFADCTVKTFDASCLKNCKTLKELSLERQFVFSPELDDSYSLCNFHLLPESIEKLHISHISILTTELGKICSSGLKNLKECDLESCGVSGLYGISGEVFQKVVLLPEICKLVVKDLRFSDSEEEAGFIRFRKSLKLISKDRHIPKETGISIRRESPSVPFRRERF